MLNYDSFKPHGISEQIVQSICNKMGSNEHVFFRNHVAYYFCQIAACMRVMYCNPNETIGRPINMYAINLGPSGMGKGYTTTIMEEHVIDQFRDSFLTKTWPLVTAHSVAKVADYRARKYMKDPEDARMQVEKEFERMGTYDFAFTEPSKASIGQLRNKLLLAGLGSINMQVDEIGLVMGKLGECFSAFLELYDGRMKNSLIKNTADQQRSEVMYGVTPTNMLAFGVPTGVFDGGKNEELFTGMTQHGLARRAHYAFTPDEDFEENHEFLTPQEMLNRSKVTNTEAVYSALSDHFEQLADPLKLNTRLAIPDNTALLLFEYVNDCKRRAIDMPMAQHIERYEMSHRFEKAKRIAGAYAFVDGAAQIEPEHLMSAIAMTEDSGDAFGRMMHREMPHVKLAKHIASSPHDLTKVTLREQLPFFKGGTKQSRDEMLSEAIDWGYTNNISIRKGYSKNVEFFSGQYLRSNDLTKLRISYGMELAYNYRSQEIAWDKIDKLAKHDNIHWINHHLENGFDNAGHRHNDNCIPGFNMIVLDIDGGMSIQQARLMLKEYRAFYYVTKRHTATEHRFRIVMPINYTLELDAPDFAAFMENLYEWLPFEVDDNTGQRSRKWLSNQGHHLFTDGKLLDALPFIPRTDKHVEYTERLIDLGNLGGLERWFVLNTSNGSGNRNNNLLRYAMMLVDGGLDSVSIRDRVLGLNVQLPQPISEQRIDNTIMKSVTKKVQARSV